MVDSYVFTISPIYSASLLSQNQHLWHFGIFCRPLENAEEFESPPAKHSLACLLHPAKAALLAIYCLLKSSFFCVSGLGLLIGDIHLQCDPKCCAKRLSRVSSGKTTVLQGVEKIHVSQASSSHAFTLSAVGAVLMNQRKRKGKSTNMSLC